MHLRDVLKKKERIAATTNDLSTQPGPPARPADIPEFTFIRTTTDLQEVISPPSFNEKAAPETTTTTTLSPGLSPLRPSTPNKGASSSTTHKRLSVFRRASAASDVSSLGASEGDNDSLGGGGESSPESKRTSKRLSKRIEEKLHISRSRSGTNSNNLPENLPAAPQLVGTGVAHDTRGRSLDKQGEEKQEAEWEKRATLLAYGPRDRSRSINRVEGGKFSADEHGRIVDSADGHLLGEDPRTIGHEAKPADEGGDVNIQEAIRLHEEGDLERSTEMFGKLADPSGENNALSQVLYGLALRHGWGCEQQPTLAMGYLQRAAENSAAIESAALSSGMAQGGAAKGELVLAMYELANSFRHGWGVKVDAPAARQYYEAAANLGDVDAMGEAGWCWMEGFGGPKDKFKAAQYLRKQEEKGTKVMGNSWIWKPKYDPK